MTPLTIASLLFSIVAISPAVAPTATQRTPDALYSTYNGTRYLLFASASAAFTADGTPSALLPDSWREQHERVRQMDTKYRGAAAQHVPGAVASSISGPCDGIRHEEPQVGSMVIRDTMESTIQHADGIFIGTIAEITPGFFNGSPASMLRLVDLTIVKHTAAYNNVTNTLLARYSFARFSAGGLQYCAGVESPEPRVGDRAMIFAFGPPLDESGIFIYSFRNDILLQNAQGLQFPPLLELFRQNRARDLNELAKFVNTRLREESR